MYLEELNAPPFCVLWADAHEVEELLDRSVCVRMCKNIENCGRDLAAPRAKYLA